MSTVDKSIADRIVAGEFADDHPVRIVKYTNAWGGEAYGVEFKGQLGKYCESAYVRNPTVYWEAK